MILTIAIMVALTIAIAAKVLAPRLADGRIIFQRNPDAPHSFGRRMAWLAIRSRDTEAVAEALGLGDWVPCNWSSGIGTVYDNELGNDRIFVAPPVNGWTFVIGLALPYPMGRAFTDKCTPLLMQLGREFVPQAEAAPTYLARLQGTLGPKARFVLEGLGWEGEEGFSYYGWTGIKLLRGRARSLSITAADNDRFSFQLDFAADKLDAIERSEIYRDLAKCGLRKDP